MSVRARDVDCGGGNRPSQPAGRNGPLSYCYPSISCLSASIFVDTSPKRERGNACGPSLALRASVWLRPLVSRAARPPPNRRSGQGCPESPSPGQTRRGPCRVDRDGLGHERWRSGTIRRRSARGIGARRRVRRSLPRWPKANVLQAGASASPRCLPSRSRVGRNPNRTGPGRRGTDWRSARP
jgi:hypothetical protein